MKLLIGIPTNGQPTRPFLDALAALVLPPSVTDTDRLVWTGNFVAVQREMIARDAVARGADLLAMIDDDIVLPPDALVRLIGALDARPQAAAAGALSYSRDSARPMAVSRWASTDTTSAAIPPYGGDRVVPVDGVGFGCVVVRVAALRALEAPYFAAHVYVDPQTRTVRQCGEDYLLCERFRDAGWNVLLHAGVRAAHDGRTRLVPFDDGAPRASERQERLDTTIVFAG